VDTWWRALIEVLSSGGLIYLFNRLCFKTIYIKEESQDKLTESTNFQSTDFMDTVPDEV
jgi:hypothetical protein